MLLVVPQCKGDGLPATIKLCLHMSAADVWIPTPLLQKADMGRNMNGGCRMGGKGHRSSSRTIFLK